MIAIFYNGVIMKKVLSAIAMFVFTSLFGIFLAFMLLEWMAGCGETYVDSKGVRHANECVFLGQK